MSDKAHKVLLLLKLVLRAGTTAEKATARANAAMICAKHALDYDALLAQAAAELAQENPEAAANAQAKVNVRPSTTWEKTPRTVWRTTTKYDPASIKSRALLADALRALLEGAKFAHTSGDGVVEEEMWSKVVGHAAGGEVVVHIGTSIRKGLVGPKGGDPIRMWATVGHSLLIDYKTRAGRKGHTVRRCGEFGQWKDGADHAHKNNPGILGRVYREMINVRDAALDAAKAQRIEPSQPSQMRESDEEFLTRIMRDFRANLEKIPHPSHNARAHNPEASMYDYVSWCVQNRFDGQGRDRWAYARDVVESVMG